MNQQIEKTPSVGIIGGGVAGTTIAMRLAQSGIQVHLFEQGSRLVSGPPICHLHAGGNLYREISEQQCVTLLRQSIASARTFPHTINRRPTVIAIPQHDSGQPDDLLPRLQVVQAAYAQLIEEDSANAIMGPAQSYFQLYDEAKLMALACRPTPKMPLTADEWMIPVAKGLDLTQMKLPLILVQEYGWSVFRLAATAELSLQQSESCHLHLNAKVTGITKKSQGWQIDYVQHFAKQCQVDWLINAAGYQSGEIDNLLGLARQRLVEFKAAYVTHWQTSAQWPEVIIHGQRGTPQGMAQLTPYPQGYFQLHGMTEDITLFEQGLVASKADDAQPRLAAHFTDKLQGSWQPEEVQARTQRAIDHLSQYIPGFATATVAGLPLFGAQQIPGDDVTLRAADISFGDAHYVRAEIVKGSSALEVAEVLLAQWQCADRVATLPQLSEADVVVHASKIAKERDYPEALALPYGDALHL
ncbi:hypothetical protein VST7929_02850 [Vibrio stylophorae]|uniref:FAD dependent oxidoreductase domain-containing protein n=1 Tax=Vibrio stylophorae TaxID=659351 RepID=A0ABM8ZX77_9VIBR|nr:FAD-dependent oxidoreductase [Vibrio stylophorae]CAH0535189.1 hypothetical protein VST7929_02850 [Vibrio stylophorae]